MKKSTASALLLLLLAIPHGLLSQDLGVGVRAGFQGFGGEAALGLSRSFALRGGFGVFPIDFTSQYSGVSYTVTPPSSIGTLGIDVYPGGRGFRLMGGFMARSGNVELQSGDLAEGGPVEIGDEEYPQSGFITGVLKTKSMAPFVGIGFGRHTVPGLGMFLDFGVAFVGDPEVELDASGDIREVPGFIENLRKEEQEIEDAGGSFLKYWPVFSVGIKLGVG
jgi:hypothetical protein